MTATEWSQVDSMPPMVSSSDLFDGDIMGDELIDIYNAAIVGGGDDDDDEMNELPSLLGPTNDTDEKESAELSHPDAQMSMDDGLGSFRASTSFNDLTTLLPVPPATNPAPVIASEPVEEPADPSGDTKRAAEGPASDSPTPKRRASGARKISSGSSASSKSKAKGSPIAATTDKDEVSTTASKTKIGTPTQPTKKAGIDTPNPLSSARTAPVPVAAAAAAPRAPIAVKAATQAIAVKPAVVSPHNAHKIEDTSTVRDEVPVAPAPVVSGAATEADFKSVAIAAVSSLMVSAATATKTESSGNAGTDTKVDTSTEHIKALTGANWVAVCVNGDIGTGESVSSGTNDKGNNRARRQNLTPDERARQNRDRNREHARNTRLRKKAYVEELKRTLTELVAQRDSADLEKRHTAQRELEQREVRFRVIEEFLKLRGRNESNFARWAAILEDSFSFTLPVTDFRKMVHFENGSRRREIEQVLTGVSEAMSDSSNIALFLQTLGKDSNAAKTPISFSYNCDRKNFFMDNCNAVLEWTATSSGAIQQGAPSELTVKGTVRANFSPASNKLISAFVSFDTGIIVSQLEHIFSHSKMNAAHNDEVAAAAAAAQVAACEADAILDSLQMPQIDASVPANVTVQFVPPSSCSGSSSGESVTSLEKDESELFLTEGVDESGAGMTTRRVLRRKV